MKESNKEIKNQKTGFFYEWVVPIVIAVILAFLINKFVIYKVKIPSESMVPTLNVNDLLQGYIIQKNLIEAILLYLVMTKKAKKSR